MQGMLCINQTIVVMLDSAYIQENRVWSQTAIIQVLSCAEHILVEQDKTNDI